MKEKANQVKRIFRDLGWLVLVIRRCAISNAYPHTTTEIVTNWYDVIINIVVVYIYTLIRMGIGYDTREKLVFWTIYMIYDVWGHNLSIIIYSIYN